MPSNAKLYIVMISLHGLIRTDDLELGRDPDTGGQTRYVVELSRRLIQHPDIEKVDLLTRQIFDPGVSDDYAEPKEEIVKGVNIVRIKCGPRRYLRKEVLWPYLDNFTDNVLKYLRRVGREPNMIHAHYADAGYVGARLSGLLEIPLTYTGHSLGRVKRQRLLDQGMQIATMENRLHIGRRIDAEEMALDNASLVIASTHQEVEEQYAIYDNYQPKRMIVIPPGVDLSRFGPPPRFWPEYPAIGYKIDSFLTNPKKPMILAISRPDIRKNISTLIHAFGANRELREKANLVLIAGSRGDIRSLEKGTKEFFTQMLTLIDYYDLYGLVAYPKKHDPDDVPALYRIAAKSGGVFVNPALTEPFGLTLLESAASGLPIVATKDGGPRDIVALLKNGILIDPLDDKKMGDALVSVISDKTRWRKWSRSGIVRTSKHYSWTGYVNKYLRAAKKIITRYGRRRMGPTIKSRMITNDRMLICDIDNTLIGDEKALDCLLSKLRKAGEHVGFGVATGRSLALARKVLRQWKVPAPNVLITSVGSKIHYGHNLVEDVGYTHHISHRWRPEAIKEIMLDLTGLKFQPKHGQDTHKISFFVDPGRAPRPREIGRLLRRANLSANLIYSHSAYLDVLPIRASKGSALRYFAGKWGIPIERFLVAGDSGNDEEMLSGNTLGVVVGNYSHELNKLKGQPNIYFAKGDHAWGIIEALERYNFLGEIRTNL
mgnify:CR=1 FL=1